MEFNDNPERLWFGGYATAGDKSDNDAIDAAEAAYMASCDQDDIDDYEFDEEREQEKLEAMWHKRDMEKFETIGQYKPHRSKLFSEEDISEWLIEAGI